MSRRKFSTNGLFKILLGLIFVSLFSCHKDKKEINYFDAIAENDIKLEKPQPGDWRYGRSEKFQTFDNFKAFKKIVPTQEKKVIYLQPIGKFSNLELKEIQLVQIYLTAYFQLETKILPIIDDKTIPNDKRRINNEGNEQLLASYILDNILKNKIPKDGIVMMGITPKDLYPKPEWNYVFGLASYHDGVGVTSIYRFHNGQLTSENFTKSLERTIKISSHEIGHMFGLSHCLNAKCVMNGTNSLSETDSRTARACSLCQRKLNSSWKFDNEKRLTELQHFFEENQLKEELKIAKLDQETIQ